MNTETRTIPQPDRPHIPGYGIPETQDGMLPWDWAVERLTNAIHVWISTTRPDGRPHAAPVWAVWDDGAIVFESGPNSRRSRNIAANPAAVVHIESGDDIVIVEGFAEAISRPDPAFALRLIEAFSSKYGGYDYVYDPANWRDGGLYLVRPRKVLAWGRFDIQDATRWTFGNS
jgi:nitroimidazol reductase NimA-like FMN-containing flavoprotein (pyridoxamine 5'-phosphate oxidase superfamily)